MNIDPSGSVSQCGRSSDLGIMNWGNVHEASIAEILQNEGLDEIEGRAKALKQGECAGCKLFPICHGGCPIDGYTHHGSFGRKTGWCAGKKRFVSKYFEPITDIRIHDLEDYV